jgi:hypothetical protein
MHFDQFHKLWSEHPKKKGGGVAHRTYNVQAESFLAGVAKADRSVSGLSLSLPHLHGRQCSIGKYLACASFCAVATACMPFNAALHAICSEVGANFRKLPCVAARCCMRMRRSMSRGLCYFGCCARHGGSARYSMLYRRCCALRSLLCSCTCIVEGQVRNVRKGAHTCTMLLGSTTYIESPAR